MLVKVLKPAFDLVDKLSIWIGKSVAWLLLGLILALTFDTFMRYLFSKPTVWAFDVAYMIGGSIMLLGMAWVTVRRDQVRVDIIYTRYSRKLKAIVDSVLNIVLFFPLYIMLIQRAIPRAIYSFTNKEFSEVGFWRPLMWPYRWMMVVALIMWVLAALVWVIKDLASLRKGEEL